SHRASCATSGSPVGCRRAESFPQSASTYAGWHTCLARLLKAGSAIWPSCREGAVHLHAAYLPPLAEGHPLHVARVNDRAHAGTILVYQLAFDHVGDDLRILGAHGCQSSCPV